MISSLILAVSLTGGLGYNQGPCSYGHCLWRGPVVRAAVTVAVAPVVVAKRVVTAPCRVASVPCRQLVG